MASKWTKNLQLDSQPQSKATQFSFQPRGRTDTHRNDAHEGFVHPTETTNRSFLPDVKASNRDFEPVTIENDARAKSKSPYEPRNPLNLHEKDYQAPKKSHPPNQRGHFSQLINYSEEKQHNHHNYPINRDAALNDHQATLRMSRHVNQFYNNGEQTKARQLPSLDQRYSRSPATKDSYAGGPPEDHNATMKRMYGQYLREQMEWNKGKKYEAKRKEIEEDRKLLVERNFFDGFGRTKEHFRHIRGKKTYFQDQSEDEDDIPPTDISSYRKKPVKIDAHAHQNYNSRHKRDHAGSYGEEEINAKYLESVPEETGDRIYSFAFLPQFHNEHLFRAQLDLLQRNHDSSQIINTPQLDEDIQNSPPLKLTKIPQPSHLPQEDQVNKEDYEAHAPRGTNQHRAQRVNAIRHRTYDKAQELRNKQEVMDYIQKMEYQRALDIQVLEKQLKEKADQKIRQLEERIEELQESRAYMEKELEKKAASPQTNHGLSNKKLIFNESSGFKAGVDKTNLKRHHYTGKKPAPPQEISNNGASSKKNILLSHESSPYKDNMYNSSEYNSANIFHYMQLQQEFSKIREELKESTRKLQKQIADMQFSNQHSVERFSDIPLPIDKKSPDYHIIVRREIIKENPAIVTTPFGTKLPGAPILGSNDSKMSLLNHTSFDHPVKSDRSREGSENRIERVALNNLLDLVKRMEKDLKPEETTWKKELQDLKIEIYDLLGGIFDKDRFDDIKENLIEISEQMQTKDRAPVSKPRPKLKSTTRGIKRPSPEFEDDHKKRVLQHTHPPT